MIIKRTTILFPVTVMMNISIQMINFAVIFFLKDLVGLSASTIGWFFAAGSGGYALGCILLRSVQNRIIPPVSMFIGLVMTISSLYMIKSATSPAIVLLYYLIFATAPAFIWPQVMGWFSFGLSNEQLGKSISKFNLSWSSGAVMGPLFGGIIAEYDIMLSFYIDIALIGFIILLLIFGLIFVEDMRRFPSHSDADKESVEGSGELINGGKGTILRYAGWISVYSVYVVLGLISNIFPLFVRETLGLGESVAGNILFVRGLTSALGFYLTGRFVLWHFNKKIMIITQLVVISVMMLLLVLKTIPAIYVLFVIFGLFFSIGYSNGIFHGSAGAADRGRRMGLFEAILTLGLITGSIGGGYLFEFFSIYTAFIFCAVIIGLGLIAQIVIFTAGKRKQLL